MANLIVMKELLAYFWFGNTVFDYLVAVGVFGVVILVFKYTQWLALRRLDTIANRSETAIDNALINMVRVIKPPFYWFLAFYLALRYLDVQGLGRRVVNIILVAWLVYQIIRALQILIEYLIRRRMDRADRDAKAVSHLITSLAGVALWILGGLFVLSNVGVNVTSLIAGLGIGGIAVALAAQNILGDFFSSLAIYFDKPFLPGDFIVMGDIKGTVQRVGIKTTRIDSLDGGEIIIPNREITSGKIKNYGRMTRRHVSFTFGVKYETPTEKMRKIPELVQQVVELQSDTHFDRTHFKEYAGSALVYEAVYYIESSDYGMYMDRHQQILLGIKEAFEQAGIEMA